MDSGANVLRQHIYAAARQIAGIDDVHFIISAKYELEADNLLTVPEGEFLSDYIPHVDLVVTRGGFNTISECIAHRVPLLLIGETENPEIEKNLLTVKQEQLGSFVSLQAFSERFKTCLLSFLDHEYESVRRHMAEHEYPTNGAEVVASEVLDQVQSFKKAAHGF